MSSTDATTITNLVQNFVKTLDNIVEQMTNEYKEIIIRESRKIKGSSHSNDTLQAKMWKILQFELMKNVVKVQRVFDELIMKGDMLVKKAKTAPGAKGNMLAQTADEAT